jgi:DNA repair exonuclease SbcCD ATPase subunit
VRACQHCRASGWRATPTSLYPDPEDMTKKVATDDVVFAAADALLAAGVQPSLKLLQERTGGSYTTVKDALKRWSAKREEDSCNPPPAELLSNGEQFVRTLWRCANEQADAAVASAREAARTQVERAQFELEHAQGQIRLLEQRHSELELEWRTALNSLQSAKSEIQEQSIWLEHLAVDHRETLRKLDQVRNSEQQHLIRASSLDGECAALRQQVSDLMQALSGSSPGRRPAEQNVPTVPSP